MKIYQKPPFFVFFRLVFFCIVFFSLEAPAADLTDWQSSEGLKRLSRSEYKIDFPGLANHFQNQTDKLSCGPATGAVVLNALRLGRGKSLQKTLPKIPFPRKYMRHLPKDFDPRATRYSPKSFMDWKAQKIKSLKELYGQPVDNKKDFGLQLRQLHEIFLSHGAGSKLRVADESLLDEVIKRELLDNLKTEGDYVVVNYKRQALGQKGGGHISPIGAYDQKTDSFLIMDVNSSRYGWVWAGTEDLIRSMRSFDTKENRGYLLIKRGSQ